MRIISAAALCLLAALPAAAQDAGAVVAAAAGVTTIDSRSELTFSGAGGFRFNRYAGLEVEVTSVPTLKSAFPADNGGVIIQTGAVSASALSSVALIYPGPTYSNENGRAVLFTNNVRVELPMPAGPLTPYFVAGGGIASIRHTADLVFPIGIVPLPAREIPPPLTNIRTTIEHVRSSSTDLALTIGGGVSVRVASRASIDGDLRYYRLMGTSDTNVGRFSVGVRYRF